MPGTPEGDGHDLFRYGTIVAFVLCYCTIILGGNVIASGSGLGCPDWPTCHGTFTPSLAGPQGVEYLHRIAAGLLSICIFALVPIAYRSERDRPILQRMTYLAAGLVLVEALLGGLVVEDALRIPLVLAHFFLATALFALLLLLAALANLRQIPRRWLVWAERAADGSSEPAERSPDAEAAPAPSVPGAPSGRS